MQANNQTEVNIDAITKLTNLLADAHERIAELQEQVMEERHNVDKWKMVALWCSGADSGDVERGFNAVSLRVDL
jgi:hypothetical protein